MGITDWIVNLIPWIVAVAIITVFAIYLYGTWPHSQLDKYGYSGPKTRIFVGNSLELTDQSQFMGHFDRDNKKKYGPVWRCYEARTPCVVIHDPELLKAVLVKKSSNFINRRHIPLRGIVNHAVTDQRGDKWKRTRQLISPFFSTQTLKMKTEIINQCCENFIENIKRVQDKDNMFEAKEVAGCLSMDVLANAGFGLDVDSSKDPDHPFVVNGLKVNNISASGSKILLALALVGLLPCTERIFNYFDSDMWPQGVEEFFTETVQKAINNKDENEAEDFIMAMIRANEDNLDYKDKVASGLIDSKNTEDGTNKGFTKDEMIANSIILLLAGYDTTSTALSFLMYCLAVHPQYQEKVYQEIVEEIGESKPDYESVGRLHYLDMCLNESLRLYSPVIRMDRSCTSGTRLDNWYIPKDTLVIVPVWAIHHDPEFWPDPETYDPDRFAPDRQQSRELCTFLPFGHGPRMCVGNRMAMLEIKMAIIRILQTYKLVANEKTEIPVTLLNGTFFMRAQNGLWLSLEAR